MFGNSNRTVEDASAGRVGRVHIAIAKTKVQSHHF
jgi:hypothetical protein